MAKAASKKAFRHGTVTVVLTVLIIVAVILLNASVTTLALRYGWFIDMNPTLYYPITDTCYEYLDTYVMPDAEDDIRIIFCSDKDEVLESAHLRFVLNSAEELVAKYPDKVVIEYLDIWENPSIARQYGVTASTSVVVASGESHRVCTLHDFFLFPVNDTSNPVAYNGEKRLAVAMKAVVSSNVPMAYLTLNHGEALPDYSLIYAITDAGYSVSYLDAASFDIPEDCALLVTYNPLRDFTTADGVSVSSEIDKLDAYLQKGGKFMTFVSADTFAAGGYTHLETYLSEWGVTFQHETGAEGVEECYAIRDTAHGLSADGYTFIGSRPATGRGSEIMKHVGDALRVADATSIAVADGYTASNGDYTSGTRTLIPLLRSHAGADAWAGGRAVDRTTEGYHLVTLTEDSATDASVLVCTSTRFVSDSSMQSGVYDNSAFLLTAMEAMGQEEIPIQLAAQPFADETIRSLTTAAARNITIALVAIPALVVAATGMIVLIRRKFA